MVGLLGWIAWVITFAASWMVGNKNMRGFYLFAIANLMLFADSLLFGYYSLTAASVAFIVLNFINLRKWKQNPPLDKKELESVSRELLDSIRHVVNQENYKSPRNYGLVPMEQVYALRDILQPKETV